MNWRWRQAGRSIAISSGVLLLVWLASSKVLLDGFGRAEDEAVRQTASGAQLAFGQRIAALSEKFGDWSSWDDMYRFAAPLSPRLSAGARREQRRALQSYRAAFVRSNLVPQSLSLLHVNVVTIVDLKGQILWGTGYDPARRRLTPPPRQFTERLRPGNRLLEPRGTQIADGLLALPSGVAIVSSRPIIHSDRTGPTRGLLIVARPLDRSEWSHLRTATGLDLSLLPLQATGASSADSTLEIPMLREMAHEARARESRGRVPGVPSGVPADAMRVVALDEKRMAVYSALHDLDGHMVGVLKMVQPRALRQQGLSTLRLFHLVFWSLGLGALSLILTLRRRSEARVRALVQNGWEIVAIVRPHEPPPRLPVRSSVHAPQVLAAQDGGDSAVLLASPQVIYISPAITRVLGYRPRQVERSSISVWIHAEDRARVMEQLGRWMRAPEGARLDALACRWRHRDGSWRDLEITGAHWPRDPDIAGLVLNARDVSEQKRAQEREQQARAHVLAEATRFSSLLQATPDAILIADGQARIVASNPAAQILFGYQEGELAGLGMSRLLPFFQQSAATEKPGGEALEVVARRGDGSEFEGEMSRAHWGGGGPDEGFTAVILRDISERKRAASRLEESARRIEASLREKEVLLKEIHHRVKNNMQVISSILSLQASMIDDASVRAALRESQGRIKSMGLIHEKLYRSDDLAHVDFADYLRGLSQDLMRSHPPRGSKRPARLNLELEPLRLELDQAAPCGLLVNELLTNALKHAFNGADSIEEPAVSVRLRSHSEEVILEVEDNGRGLDAGFDWRASESLGLQLVAMLAEQLEGAVRCESSVAGTRWQVQFEGRR